MGKEAKGGHDLACRGLTYATLEGASFLLNTYRNIAEVGQLIFTILFGRVSPFKEMIDWLQFAYTAYSTEACVALASTVLVPSAVSEGDSLFPAFWKHLLRRFPGAYALTLNTRGPLEPDFIGTLK